MSDEEKGKWVGYWFRPDRLESRELSFHVREGTFWHRFFEQCRKVNRIDSETEERNRYYARPLDSEHS